MKTLTTIQAVELIKDTNNIFTVTFIKKDNTLREMNCRLNVSKYTNGKGQAYNPADYDLLTVYDMKEARKLEDIDKAKAYRNINLRTLQTLTVNGESFKINTSVESK